MSEFLNTTSPTVEAVKSIDNGITSEDILDMIDSINGDRSSEDAEIEFEEMFGAVEQMSDEELDQRLTELLEVSGTSMSILNSGYAERIDWEQTRLQEVVELGK